MKLEKRSEGQPSEAQEETPQKGKKPVLVYIMVLFIAAFLLMALSFAAHQRSNSEAIGQIQSSVSGMRDVQGLQEQVIALQDELLEARKIAEEFQDANETSRNQASHLEYLLEQSGQAMDWFWQLNEAFVQDDRARCGEILDTMNENAESPLSGFLPENSAAAARYQEILEALEQE